MPVFTPVVFAAQLPLEGKGYETFTMDLKRRLGGPPFEHAKDVAAFANHLGGTIVVGIAEANGLASKWMALSDAEAAETERAYRNALDLCHPPPVVNCEKLAVERGFIVAVNVWPYPSQVVGVRLPLQEGEKRPREVYAFPLRTGTKTSYLSPENLRMFMTPEIRRVVILLNAIPVGAKISFVEAGSATFVSTDGVQVDESKNAVVASAYPGNMVPMPPNPPRRIRTWALDHINTVFEEAPNMWRVLVAPHK